jgi:hypothetical protein
MTLVNVDRLSFEEVVRLETLEAEIQEGLESFIKVGNCLLEIRESRLYRETHKTFEEYCQVKYGLSYRRAHHLMESAAIVNGLEEENLKNFSGLGDEEVPATLLPKNDSQARALKPFAPHMRPTILQLANAKAQREERPLTTSLIQSVGKTLTEAATTGYVDIGDGESTAFDAAVPVDEHETIQRKKLHISEHYEEKNSQGQWKDHLSDLTAEDQVLVRDVHRDLLSNHGKEKSLQSIAFDAKALAKTDTWEQATPDQKREMLHERFAEKQAKSYEKPEPKQVQTTPDDVKSLMVACQNLIECAGIKTVNSFVKEQIRSNLEKVNEIMGRYLA